PQMGDAKVLGVELRACEPPLDPWRALAHRVLELLFQVHDRIRAHQFSLLKASVLCTGRQAEGRSTHGSHRSTDQVDGLGKPMQLARRAPSTQLRSNRRAPTSNGGELHRSARKLERPR